MSAHPVTCRGIFIVACAVTLCATFSPAGAGKEKDDKPAFSQRFDFVTGKEIPLDEVVGRVHFASVKIETEKWESGGYHLRVRIAARNPKHGHDQKVRAHVEFASKEGKVLASDEDEMGIEEDEDETLKLSAHMEGDPASEVAAFLLELDAWDD